MATPVYSTQFVCYTVTDGSPATYDVTTGFVVVVRDISVTFNNPWGELAAEFAVDFAGIQFYTRRIAPGAMVFDHWEGHVVAPAPNTLTAAVSGAGASAEAIISGYLLTAP